MVSRRMRTKDRCTKRRVKRKHTRKLIRGGDLDKAIQNQCKSYIYDDLRANPDDPTFDFNEIQKYAYDDEIYNCGVDKTSEEIMDIHVEKIKVFFESLKIGNPFGIELKITDIFLNEVVINNTTPNNILKHLLSKLTCELLQDYVLYYIQLVQLYENKLIPKQMYNEKMIALYHRYGDHKQYYKTAIKEIEEGKINGNKVFYHFVTILSKDIKNMRNEFFNNQTGETIGEKLLLPINIAAACEKTTTNCDSPCSKKNDKCIYEKKVINKTLKRYKTLKMDN